MSYFEKTKVANSVGTVINPAEEESNILLRRIVKLLESNAVVDSNNRQKVNVDAGTLTTVTTVTNASTFSNVDARYLFIDTARNAYANGIRSKLTFT